MKVPVLYSVPWLSFIFIISKNYFFVNALFSFLITPGVLYIVSIVFDSSFTFKIDIFLF